MKLIIGLGNPGTTYQKTRHNIGFHVIDTLVKLHKTPPFSEKSKFNALISETHLNNENVTLVKPLTFMNLSGKSVMKMYNFYSLSPSDIWVVCDDLDLPFETLKIRPHGGPGTHNGLKSISESIGSNDYPRFKLGIESRSDRQKAQGAKQFVLSRFTKDEEERLPSFVKQAAHAITYALENDLNKAMNKYN
ncbi:aminoacyl-tRNA hydrolase [Candidatus Peregrinibacteria bacterium]|nr:aminoacyl-tRNA hydrolase [Candidatus Peregrinibacteria bacterium]